MHGSQARSMRTISQSLTGRNWMQLKIMITVIQFMNSDAGCGVAMVLLTMKLEQLLSKKWVDWQIARLLYLSQSMQKSR